jgi:undecaprenyl-phosphate 4-deoxy-4-formamido-L-arabinose transferase
MLPSVSYIIAGYNEELLIDSSVRECHEALSSDFSDFEIILIDDGSTDDTKNIMDSLSHELSNTRVLHNLVNLNFGASVLRGLKAATKDVVIYNAADLPLSPKLTFSIVQEMQNYDLLVLERREYHATGWRKLASKTNTVLLHVFFPRLMKGTPVLNFTQAFNKQIIDLIIPAARSPIFVWPEMIFRAKMNDEINVGNMVVDVNISETRRGSFGKPHDIIWGVYDMFRFRIKCWGNMTR